MDKSTETQVRDDKTRRKCYTKLSLCGICNGNGRHLHGIRAGKKADFHKEKNEYRDEKERHDRKGAEPSENNQTQCRADGSGNSE